MKRRFFGAMSLLLLTRSSEAATVQLGDVLADTSGRTSGPLHDPPLEPRDEAVFLLTAAAEIEHALMVQYLYAAYSLRIVDGEPLAQKLKPIQELLLQIAREEMGHLATVQNLLHLLGGPLSFNREHSPYASEIYPFRFKLEPLSLDSLAKYVVAESPMALPADFPAEDVELFEQIKKDAKRSNDGRDVQHVGPIFARLEQIFASGDEGVKDEDFRLDTAAFQAKFADWGFQPRTASGAPTGEKLIVDSIEAQDPVVVRDTVIKAVRAIGQQGEGFDLPPTGPGETESHFERFFFQIYKPVKDLSSGGSISLTWPLAETPNTTMAAPQEDTKLRRMHMMESIVESHLSKGRITDQRTRAWAHLFNLRYRNLIAYFSHFLRLDQQLYIVDDGPKRGDHTARGLLLIWTFNEMRRLKKLAGKLVQMPKDDSPNSLNAGPPFELPYTLNLPDRESDRWRTHIDVLRASARLINELRAAGAPDEKDGFLEDLLTMDEEAQTIMKSLSAGKEIPDTSLPKNFRKVVSILEEAVRGFDIGSHKSFWEGISRNDFVTGGLHPLVPEVVRQKPDGSFDPNESVLVKRLEGTASGNQMPRFRPKVSDSRIQFLRDWIQGGCSDEAPAEPVSVHERSPTPEPIKPPAPPPPTAQPLSFAQDVKGLFREVPDREDMQIFSGFDLHKFEDIRDRADAILAVLVDGSMPCDGSWPPDRIAIFRKWIEDGKQP
jgi:rubrerythrin